LSANVYCGPELVMERDDVDDDGQDILTTKTMLKTTIGCCWSCNRQMTLIKEFRHCTAFILGLIEFPRTSIHPTQQAARRLFEVMEEMYMLEIYEGNENESYEFWAKGLLAENYELHEEFMKHVNMQWPKTEEKQAPVKGKKSQAKGKKPSAKTKDPPKGQSKYYEPFQMVSNSLYDLMLTMVIILINVRFSLQKDEQIENNWHSYYEKNKVSVQEHVKYVILCNMHIEACHFTDDSISKNLVSKKMNKGGESTGLVQKKHLFRNCAALYTAALVYDSIRIFNHYVEKSTDKDHAHLTMSLPEFWKFVVVECANHGIRGGNGYREEFLRSEWGVTPFKSIFGPEGLRDSGAELAGNEFNITQIYLNWTHEAIKCVSKIWDPDDGRFCVFLHRVLFDKSDSTQRDTFAHKICPECHVTKVSEKQCLENHTLPKLLEKADELLVTGGTREQLVGSIRFARNMDPSSPSDIVKQLPCANRIHAVQMFLRMAQIFNEDVQTVAIKTAIRMELQNLYADKQPFGKPK
jgi:hypothetical protein